MFLPGFLLGVASCWHKNMLKTIVAHPFLVLMPTFTHYTLESSTMWSGHSQRDIHHLFTKAPFCEYHSFFSQ